jgi:WD40 repeat protein
LIGEAANGIVGLEGRAKGEAMFEFNKRSRSRSMAVMAGLVMVIAPACTPTPAPPPTTLPPFTDLHAGPPTPFPTGLSPCTTTPECLIGTGELFPDLATSFVPEAISDDGNLIVVLEPAGPDGQSPMGLADMTTQTVQTIPGHGVPYAADMTPDGRFVVIARADSVTDAGSYVNARLYLYDATTGRLTRPSQPADEDIVENVHISADGRWAVAVVGHDGLGDVVLFDLSTNTYRVLSHNAAYHIDWVNVSDDGSTVVYSTNSSFAPTDQQIVTVHDVASGASQKVFGRDADISADGHLVAYAHQVTSNPQTDAIEVLNRTTGVTTEVDPGGGDQVNSLALSADGSRLIASETPVDGAEAVQVVDVDLVGGTSAVVVTRPRFVPVDRVVEASVTAVSSNDDHIGFTEYDVTDPIRTYLWNRP